MSLQSPHALLNEMTIKWLSVLKTFRVLKVFVLSREKAQCITFPVVADQTLTERVVIRSRNDAVSAKL